MDLPGYSASPSQDDLPICIPQVKRGRSPFSQAYSPILLQCGISDQEWLQTLSQINAAMVSASAAEVQKILQQANTSLFGPCHLNITICKLDDILKDLGIAGPSTTSGPSTGRSLSHSAQAHLDMRLAVFRGRVAPLQLVERGSDEGSSFDKKARRVELQSQLLAAARGERVATNQLTHREVLRVEKAQRRGGETGLRRQLDRAQRKLVSHSQKLLWLVVSPNKVIFNADDLSLAGSASSQSSFDSDSPQEA